MPGTDKIMHVRLLINGSLIMLADDFSAMMGDGCSKSPEALGGSPITQALHFDDVQSFWEKAVSSGVDVTMPLADTFWVDRYGQFTDPFGHRWSASQTLKTMTDSEMQAAAFSAMSTKGAPTGNAGPGL